MPDARDRPHGSSNFRVDLGRGDPGAASSGFCEVVFPTFGIDAAAPAHVTDTAAATPGTQRLILKRGVTGALDLYAWWNKARRGTAPRQRTVKVELLADDHETVVLTWRFRNARPVSLSYSPLRAMEGGIAIETIELAFDSVEMS